MGSIDKRTDIVALVQPAGQGEYKLTLCTRTGVPEYTPPLPEPTIFSTKSVDRDFFFHKCELFFSLRQVSKD